MISPSQRPLPDNTQYSQQTNIHALGGIRPPDRSRRAAVDLRLRPRGYWDRLRHIITILYYIKIDAGRHVLNEEVVSSKKTEKLIKNQEAKRKLQRGLWSYRNALMNRYIKRRACKNGEIFQKTGI